MVNYNGNILAEDDFKVSTQNRAFKYGDGIFDTLKCLNEHVYFIEDHYFRLMSSMRMLRMKIPMHFTLEYYETQIKRTLSENGLLEAARVRVSVFREDGGYYAPLSNEANFLIEVKSLTAKNDTPNYEIELYKDFQTASGLLSTIKTNNRIINVLAGIYAQENEYQNCILINEKKEVVEAINANIFLIRGNEILTPWLESGCINGIVRKKLIESLQKQGVFSISETQISPFDLLKVDEVFLTNSVTEIQIVDRYRKKHYSRQKSVMIKELFERELKKSLV
jgi:branched-chain amino acid aminotransferase